jgi:hypothetical protein
VLRIAFLVGVVAACHTSDSGAPDGGNQHDAPASGLHVNWLIKPSVPGTISNATVETVVFKLATLRVTGDAGSISTPASVDLHWEENEEPKPVDFAAAPSGLYSKLALRIDGQLLDNSYWILGHVTVNGTVYPFKIYDRDYLDIPLAIAASLAPGHGANVVVRVRLDQAVGAIDWTKIDNENGTLVLDTLDAWMPTFRQKLVDAFEVVNGGA